MILRQAKDLSAGANGGDAGSGRTKHGCDCIWVLKRDSAEEIKISTRQRTLTCSVCAGNDGKSRAPQRDVGLPFVPVALRGGDDPRQPFLWRRPLAFVPFRANQEAWSDFTPLEDRRDDTWPICSSINILLDG